jgi:hypothetical protein
MSRANITPRQNPSAEPEPDSGNRRGWVLPLVVALLVIAVFVLIGVAKRAEKRPAGPEPAPAVPAEPVAAPAPSAPPAVPTPVATATDSPSTNASAALKLQGVGFNAARPWAIVNGKTVYAGDRVSGGYRVKEISPNTLTLEDTNGSSRTLFLGK